jgi:hypothetical protein
VDDAGVVLSATYLALGENRKTGVERIAKADEANGVQGVVRKVSSDVTIDHDKDAPSDV